MNFAHMSHLAHLAHNFFKSSRRFYHGTANKAKVQFAVGYQGEE